MADAPRAASIGARLGAFRPRARRRARTSAPPNSSSPAGTTARSSSSRDRDMTRSVWKGPFVDGYLLRKAEAARSSGRHEMIKIWSRRSTILPQFVGLNFGEFAPGRMFYGHSSDRKAKRAAAAPAAPGAPAAAPGAAPAAS